MQLIVYSVNDCPSTAKYLASKFRYVCSVPHECVTVCVFSTHAMTVSLLLN